MKEHNPNPCGDHSGGEEKIYALRGLLRSIPLSEFLTALQTGQKTGSVMWSFHGATRMLYVDNGVLIYASDQGDRDGAQRAIQQKPDISAKDIREATARGLDGDALVRHLAERDLLTPADMTAIIIARVLRFVADGLYISDGDIEFIEGKQPVEPLCQVAVEVPFALMMAAHDNDERRRAESFEDHPPVNLELEQVTSTIHDVDWALPGGDRKPLLPIPQFATLTHYYNGAKHKTYSLGPGERLLGRGENADIRLIQDRAVSRIHAKISGRQGRFFIEDMDSANGVTINGVRIQRYELLDGDEITIGSHLLVFDRENTQG